MSFVSLLPGQPCVTEGPAQLPEPKATSLFPNTPTEAVQHKQRLGTRAAEPDHKVGLLFWAWAIYISSVGELSIHRAVLSFRILLIKHYLREPIFLTG